MAEDQDLRATQEKEYERMKTYANFCAFVDNLQEWPLEGFFDKELFKKEYAAMNKKYPDHSPSQLVEVIFYNIKEMLTEAYYAKDPNIFRFNDIAVAIKKLIPLFLMSAENNFEHTLNDMQKMHIKNFVKFLDTIEDKYFGIGTSAKEEIAEFFETQWKTNPNLSLKEITATATERAKQDKTLSEPEILKLTTLIENGLAANFRKKS